ncbi:cytidine deaminase [Lacrimispora sp.]|uniref:cytidine deaminase n=1 Tax=Lacrimispora sp. TaxID=2719234 RepID=UPI00399180DD
MDETTKNMLVAEAYEAQKTAYVPYSNFSVGAALLAKNGTVYRGCNIENASYSPTNCAERTAFFKAISEGVTEFEAIAVVGNKKGEKGGFCAPCGVCRQVMAEFCDPDEFLILLGAGDRTSVYTLKDMLPLGFTNKNLKFREKDERLL